MPLAGLLAPLPLLFLSELCVSGQAVRPACVEATGAALLAGISHQGSDIRKYVSFKECSYFLFGVSKGILGKEQKISKFPGLSFCATNFTWKELKEGLWILI